jgi:ABC-2 type transport system ATP-binding protein
VLAAAARREFSSDQITYAPSIDVFQGVITGTNEGSMDSSRNLPLTYTVVGDPTGGGKVDIDAEGDFTFLPYATQLNPDGTEQFDGPEQFKVLVAETTPFDTALEGLPVAGGLVQPILVEIHQVPIVNDVLAPVIGYATVTPVNIDVRSLADNYNAPIAFTTTVISFDKTPISVNYFPAVGLSPGQIVAPTILNGPSLATAGYTDPNQQTTVFGLVPGLKPLRADGYNVVTWDPRGEFASGGVLQLDSPDFEAKDVSAIIDWVANQPETEFDRGTTDNPLLGMVGGSYGGGIQLVSAGIDPRIDAIMPGIAWNSLNGAVYPRQAFKTSFASLLLLSLAVTGSRIDPTIYSGIITGDLLGILTQRWATSMSRRCSSRAPSTCSSHCSRPSTMRSRSRTLTPTCRSR